MRDLRMEAAPSRSGRSLLAGLAAGMGVATLVLYVLIIRSEGNNELTEPRILFVAFAIAGSSLSAVAGTLTRHPGVRVFLLALSTFGFLFMGIVGLFSIGILLLVAGGLAMAAWIASLGAVTPRRPAISIAAALLALLVVVGGVWVTGESFQGDAAAPERGGGQAFG